MIGLEIEDSALARQVQALEAFTPVLQREFSYAGERTGQDLKRDLRGGVGKVSGQLAESITGAVRPVGEIEIDLVMGALAVNRGYDYGMRLDKDGSLTWRSGRYVGRRTWGWFSYSGPRVAKRYFKRNYQLALDRAVRKLVAK